MSHVAFLLNAAASSLNAIPNGLAASSLDWRLADGYINEAADAHQHGDDKTAKSLLRLAAPILRDLHKQY